MSDAVADYTGDVTSMGVQGETKNDRYAAASGGEMLTLRRHLLALLQELACGYGWVALLPSARAGAMLALVTWIDPGVGVLGAAGAVSAWYAGQLAGADATERPVCVFNGLLVGLFVGHVWYLGTATGGLALMGGMFAGWLTVVLGRLAWSQLQLPVLSLPFSLVAMLTAAAGGSLTALRYRPYVAPPEIFGGAIDKFLTAFGNLYFAADPLAGMAVLGVLLFYSRYYLLLSLLGYGTALAWVTAMGAAPEHLAGSAWECNAILAALLVGGLFARPSVATAVLATLAAVMACWLALALGRILDSLHLVPFSAPFVLAAWLTLYAAVRNVRVASHVSLLMPDLPERSFERAQVARGRVGEPASVPLALPFVGVWTVSQGVDGEHTHHGPWRHALDFIVSRGGRSFAGDGRRVEDFHCYNLPVLSPAYGQVWQVTNDIPDNAPGQVNVAANWGNCVGLRLQDGKFVVVAHLRQGSVTVAPGAWLKPGDLIGYCGNSGRSPQPHIHLHVQSGAEPDAPTVPFHLANVLVSEADGAARYELATMPRQGLGVHAAAEGDVRPFYLLAGRGLRYTVSEGGRPDAAWTLHCEVDAGGRLALVSSAGGRCLAESTWAAFSCVDRDGTADRNLDLWLLACGFTPASYQVERWQDRHAPARLLPRSSARWLAELAWPCAAFAVGDYRRRWDADAQAWRQEASYRQRLTGIGVTTEALLAPQVGCTYACAEWLGGRIAMQATSIFQRADIGVPAWEAPLAHPASHPYSPTRLL